MAADIPGLTTGYLPVARVDVPDAAQERAPAGDEVRTMADAVSPDALALPEHAEGVDSRKSRGTGGA